MTDTQRARRGLLAWLGAQEELNFLLTNRIPRRLLTQLVGRLSRIEHPLFTRAAIALWQRFAAIDLTDAETTRFASVHACFTRRLRPGARPIDPDPRFLVSPCDAILGAHGRIEGDMVLQVKGLSYSLADLLGDASAARPFAGGTYATLRLTAGMYHHFHAPADLTVASLTYLAGDCWNVNPAAIRRIARLYCRNERAAVGCRLETGAPLMLVAVGAILVASIRLTFLAESARALGPHPRMLDLPFSRGAELGWFEHGSTIVLLAPPGYAMLPLGNGARLRMGQPLLSLLAGANCPAAGDDHAPA